jgi:hypothetical protein
MLRFLGLVWALFASPGLGNFLVPGPSDQIDNLAINYEVGLVLYIGWSGTWSEADPPNVQPPKTSDLWITSWDDDGYLFELASTFATADDGLSWPMVTHLTCHSANLNLGSDGTFRWAVYVPDSELVRNSNFILRVGNHTDLAYGTAPRSWAAHSVAFKVVPGRQPSSLVPTITDVGTVSGVTPPSTAIIPTPLATTISFSTQEPSSIPEPSSTQQSISVPLSSSVPPSTWTTSPVASVEDTSSPSIHPTTVQPSPSPIRVSPQPNLNQRYQRPVQPRGFRVLIRSEYSFESTFPSVF